MSDVFISYSRKDSDVVKEIVHILEQDGISVWIDLDGIESGDAFKKQIVKALDECKLVLFFSSEASNSSRWTEKEINVAIDNDLPIIPIRLDMTRYNPAVRFDLSGLDYIDLTNPEKKTGMINRLRRSVKAKLENKKVVPVPATAIASSSISTTDIISRQLTPEEIKKSEGFKRVKDGASNLYGFQDSETKEMVIDPMYEDAEMRFVNGIARAKKNGRWGCIDMYGRTIIPFDYGYLSGVPDSDGIVCAAKNGYYGIIGTHGRIIIPFEYEELTEYAPLMIAKRNGFYGVIDSNNQVYFPFRCSSSSDIVVLDDKVVLINRDYYWGLFSEGRFVFPCEYYFIKPVLSGLYELADQSGQYLGDLSGSLTRPVWGLLGQALTIQAGQVLVALERDVIPCIDKNGRILNMDKCAVVCFDDHLSIHPIEDTIRDSSGRCFACAHGLWGEITLPTLYGGVYLFIEHSYQPTYSFSILRGEKLNQELPGLFKEKCRSLDSSIGNREITAMYKKYFETPPNENILQWEARCHEPRCIIPFMYKSIEDLKRENG